MSLNQFVSFLTPQYLISQRFVEIVILSLLLLLLALFIRKSELFSKIVCLSILLTFLANLFLLLNRAVVLYFTYRNSEGLERYFLPPYTNYYSQQVARGFLSYFITIALALGLAFILWVISSILKRSLCSISQLNLVFLGAFICGWPNMILYIGLVLIIPFLVFSGLAIFKHQKIKKEMDLTPYFIIACLIIYIAGNLISGWIGLDVLRLA